MVMDTSTGGLAGRIAIVGTSVTVVLAILGAAYNFSNTINEINGKQDRNCRILVQLDQDIRLHILSGLQDNVRRGHSALAPFPRVAC